MACKQGEILVRVGKKKASIKARTSWPTWEMLEHRKTRAVAECSSSLASYVQSQASAKANKQTHKQTKRWNVGRNPD